MRKIELFGSGIKSRSDFITSQRRINVYYNLRQDSEKSKLVLIATPGLSQFVTLPTYPARGMVTQGNNAYVVSGGTLYVVQPSGNYIALGSFGNLTAISPVSMCFNETQLLLLDGFGAYYYPYAAMAQLIANNPNVTAASLVAAGFKLLPISGFPATGAQTCICNDGYGIVEQPNTGNWFISKNQNFSTWSVLDTATMESFSDIIRAVDYPGGGVVALMGQQSIEYWQDQPSNSQFPYQRLDGYQVNYGIAAVFSRAQYKNGIAFLGQNQNGQAHVLFMSPGSLVPQPISTSDIDTIINSFTVINDAVGQAFDVNGQSFYAITFPTEGRTFLLEGTQTESWSELQSGLNDTARWNSQFTTTLNNRILVGDSTSGNVYILDPANPTENGAQIKRQLVTRELKMDGNEFKISELFLDVELGVGNPLSLNPQLVLEVSKNNGKTWNIPRPISLGQVGQYLRRVVWRKLGKARSFKLRFTMTDVGDFVVTGGYAETRPGVKAASGGG